MLQESPYLSKNLSYLAQLDTQSVEQLIYRVLDLDQDEQKLLDQMIKQSGSKICGQQATPNEYFIRCHDCGISENHIFCQTCFEENVHQNHQIQLLSFDSGFCDCGDPDSIKAEGFCQAHSKKESQNKLNDLEIKLLGKLKILLEISCYNAIRFLEQNAKLPIIKAEKNLIQNSQSLLQSYQFQQISYNAYDKMNTIIILYLTGSNPKLSEIICQVFTSPIPISLQFIEQFQNNHKPIFDLGRLLEENIRELCECSVWKNLLRYIIFLNSEYNQVLNIERYIPHLFIDNYVDVITKTFVEMIPFQMLNFNLYVPLNYQQGLNNYLQSEEVKDQNCTKQQTKEVQITSDIFAICYQIDKKIIQQFKFHKDQIEYVGWFISQGVLCSKRFYKILLKLRVKLFRKLEKLQILYCLDEFFQNDPIDSYAFRRIISFIPCKPYQKHKNLNLQYEEKDIFKLILNQCNLIILFDQIFKGLIENCEDKVQKLQITQLILQNLFQKMIKAYPINYQNQFKLQKLQFIFAQFVSADHIMIILLSFYFQLIQVQQGEEFIQIIVEEFQISKHQFEQLFTNLTHRAIQNLALIKATNYQKYYSRKVLIYTLSDYMSQFSQESIDRSIIQMYFFLYGEKAIVAACKYVEYINQNFKTNLDRDGLINTALLSDFDMYQTCSHYFKDELPQDFKAAQRKVIRSLFYAQNYFSFNQILDNFNQMGNNQPNMLYQNNLLEILELEQYSGQLKLKIQYQPPLFEPLYFRNQAIFKQIEEKLSESNNREINVFGNSIDYDFSCTDENQKTLSVIRKHIIDQLLKGQNLMTTIILSQLNFQRDENIKRDIIKSNKQLVYLFIIAFKYLNIPEFNQQVLQHLFDIIQEFSIQNDIIDILKQSIIVNKQIIQVKQANKNNNQKLQLMKQKFQQKQQILAQLKMNIILISSVTYVLSNWMQSQMMLINQCCFNQITILSIIPRLRICNIYNILRNQAHHTVNQHYLDVLIFFILNAQKNQKQLKYMMNNFISVYFVKAQEIKSSLFVNLIQKQCFKILNISLQYLEQICLSIIMKNIILMENWLLNQQMQKQFYRFISIIQDRQLATQAFMIFQTIYRNLNNLPFLQKNKLMNKYRNAISQQFINILKVQFFKFSHHHFNIETQQFSQDILKILSNFGLLNYHKDIFEKLFNYQSEIQQCYNLKSIIEQKVEVYTNIRDLQRKLIQKCIVCQKFSQYICIGCNQKVCKSFQVILDYRKSCCYSHGLKCHNGKVNILDAQTGVGYVAYQLEIVLYQKSLFKTKLGQQFEGDFQNSIQYQADPIAFQEFYHIQIHNKQMTYIIKNKK